MNAKVIILKVISLVLSIAPIGVFLGVNHDVYFTTNATSIGIGGFMGVFILLIVLKDKMGGLLKNNAQLKVSAFLLFLFWGLREISDDLLVICALSVVGAVIAIIPNAFASKESKIVQREQTAKAHATAMTSALSDAGIVISKK